MAAFKTSQLYSYARGPLPPPRALLSHLCSIDVKNCCIYSKLTAQIYTKTNKMPVLSLQKIALGKLSLKDVNKLHFSEKGIVNRTFMEYLEEVNSPVMFRSSIARNRGHICMTRQFDVWHGSMIGPRKFRNKTLCKCVCPGT